MLVGRQNNLNYTHLIIACSRVLLVKLNGTQLVKKFLNPIFHYRIHKCPPPAPIMSQIDLVHTLTSHFLKNHPNIILAYNPQFPKWTPSLRFPHQTPVYASYLPHICYIPCQSHMRFGTIIVATIYLQLIQNRYMFQSFTVLQCSHQHCVQPVASDVEIVGYL